MRDLSEERIKDKTKLINSRARPNPAKQLYAHYVRLLCLCLVEFSCLRVSCEIKNWNFTTDWTLYIVTFFAT